MDTALTFFLRRLLRLGVVLSAVVVMTFAMVHLVPGDPARAVAGTQADQQSVDVVRKQFGLDKPIGTQFTDYVVGLVHGDLGTSFKTREPVSEVVKQNLPPTAGLAAAAVVVIIVLGLSVGLLFGIATQGGNRRVEGAFSAISGALVTIPHYLAATFLVFLFAITWQIFPVAGASGFSSLILPALAMSLRPAMVVARVVRVRTLEVVEQPYVRTARSKRLSPLRIYGRHVLPNTLPAALAIGGVLFASLIGGAVVIETVFARPGLGSTLVQSVITGDYPVVQGITIVLAFGVVVMNLTIDLLLAVFDPQMKGS
jgi:peptide/nickel transport system permease protein